MSPIKIQAMIASQSFSTLHAKDKQKRKRVTILSGVINPDHEKEEGLLLNNKWQKEYVWHSSKSTGS